MGGLDPVSLKRTRDLVAGLAATHEAARLFEKGARAVVAGRPNAGKSSLFNLLVREERSIVASDPGTTRDWIESGIELGGLPVRLIDTAGLREAEGEVEAAGVSHSRRLAEGAEAVIYVVDGCAGLASDDSAFLAARPDALRVWNKVDAPGCAPAPAGFLRLSAATGEGLPALADALRDRISSRFGDSFGEGVDRSSETAAFGAAIVASDRQKLLLDRAVSAFDACLSGLDSGAPLDALALDLRDAADALGEMTGEIASEEVLEAVFSRFCLGK